MPDIFTSRPDTQERGTDAEEQLFESGAAETSDGDPSALPSVVEETTSSGLVGGKKFRRRRGRRPQDDFTLNSSMFDGAPTDPEFEIPPYGKHRHVDEYSETMKYERPERNPLASFMPKPPDVRFSEQNTDEHVVLLLRQALITQLGWVVIAVALAFFPLLFSSIGFFADFPLAYRTAAGILWYLLLTGFVLEQFLKWFFNVYILTDERIIDIDFLSLIYRSVSAAKIDNIEDTTASTGGFLASIFNYGTVTIQTAAEKREFEFANVPQPTKVTRLINELILEEEREKIEGRTH